MYKYSLVLVDADGTLLDFEKSEYKAIKNTLQAFNIEQNKENIEAYVAINANLWLALERGEISQAKLKTERFKQLLHLLNMNENLAQDMANCYISELMKGQDLIDGALDFVKEISKTHKICLVTNGISQVQRARMKGNPISDYIHGLYISEEVGAAKPDPLMINKALLDNNIKNKADVIMIGDSLSSDIKAANNAGVDSVYIYPYATDMECSASFTVKNVLEALNIVLQKK